MYLTCTRLYGFFGYNYDPLANVHDESCISKVYGCVDETAFNFDAESNTDDGSCYPIILGCLDEFAFNYNNYGTDKFIGYDLSDVHTNVNTPDDSCIPINEGCLDTNAVNYNDYDMDGEANLDSTSFDHILKLILIGNQIVSLDLDVLIKIMLNIGIIR